MASTSVYKFQFIFSKITKQRMIIQGRRDYENDVTNNQDVITRKLFHEGRVGELILKIKHERPILHLKKFEQVS